MDMDYKFNSKEKDEETGMYYYEARYYTPEVSVWLSVDPMSDKYPGLSPFSYCANNPVMLVDPDGKRIFAVNDETKKFMMTYFEDQFGSSTMFRFNKHNELKINRREYKTYMRNSNKSIIQKELLKETKNAIKSPKVGKAIITGNSEDFSVKKSKMVPYTYEYGGTIYQGEREDRIYNNYKMDGSAKTVEFGNIYILMNNDKSSKETYEDINGGQTGKSASSVFMHELLDEFLGKNPSEPIKYHNKALKNKGLKERCCHEK